MLKNCMFLIFFVHLVSCQSSDGVDNPKVGLVKVSEYELPLPLNNAPNSWMQKFYDGDGKNSLYYFDKYTQEMLIYNIKERDLAEKFPIRSKGPEGFGPASSFSVKSPDSIYFAVGGLTFFYIVNSKGEKLGEMKYDWSVSSDQVQDYTSLESRYYNDLSFNERYHFGLQRVPYRGFPPPEINHYPIVRHDEKTGESMLVPFEYPAKYWSERLPDNMTFNHDRDYLYFSLTADHNVYRVKKSDFSVNKVQAKSGFAPNEMPNTRNIGSPDDVMLYDAMNPRYTAILPDKYRDLYYRIVCLPPTDLNVAKQKFNQLHFYPDRFSIMVLNKDLELLYEHEFPERIYYPHGIFINAQGINVPRTHPEYQVSQGLEDEMAYDVFEVRGI